MVVEFRLGTRINNAQQDAQAKINAIRADFPKDMKEPVIQRIDFNAMPIVSIAVESPTADIKVALVAGGEGDQEAARNGAGRRAGEPGRPGAARDPDPAGPRQAARPTASPTPQVAAALQRENMDVPAGKLEQGRQEPLVRVAGKFRSVEAFDRLIVANAQRQPDLPAAGGARRGRHRRAAQRVADRRPPGLSLDIVKQSGANTVEVADAHRASHRTRSTPNCRRTSGCARWWTGPPSSANPWRTCR